MNNMAKTHVRTTKLYCKGPLFLDPGNTKKLRLDFSLTTVFLYSYNIFRSWLPLVVRLPRHLSPVVVQEELGLLRPCHHDDSAEAHLALRQDGSGVQDRRERGEFQGVPLQLRGHWMSKVYKVASWCKDSMKLPRFRSIKYILTLHLVILKRFFFVDLLWCDWG